MSDIAYVLAALVLGIALTGLFMGLSLWVGFCLGKSAVPCAKRAPIRRVERLYHDLALCLKLSEYSAIQAEQLSAWAIQPGTVPKEISANIRELMATTESLKLRLQKAAHRKNGPEPIPATRLSPTAPQAAADRPDLSAKELGQFTKTELRRAAADGDSTRRRFAYECLQRVVPWDDPNSPPPSAGDAAVVWCHDLSMQGISFFWPEDPDFKHLLISLGKGDELLVMAAEIVHTKPVYMRSDWQYVVNCRFMKRMPELADQWRLHETGQPSRDPGEQIGTTMTVQPA